jgi:hypothetical protein
MNKTMKNLFNMTALLIVLSFGACKNDDEPNAHDKKVDMISAHSWGDATVTHADGDLSSEYDNFVIVFNNNSSDGFDGTFVIGNGGYAFSETSGHWKFSDDVKQIILDSGKEMDFELSGNSLQLDFTVAAAGGGRAAGLSGHFVFDLKPL